MTTRRAPDFDLAAAIRTSGFTAREGDLAALIALLTDEDDAIVAAAERALVDLAPRLGARLAPLLEAQLAAARRPLRGQLVRLYGKLALGERDLEHRPLTARLRALVADDDPKASRNALIALGKLPAPETERALLAVLAAPRDAAHRRSAVDALGKIGGPESLAALRRLAPDPADPELARLRAQALLRLERTLGRDVESRVDLDATVEHDVAVTLTCRPGLEPLLVEELVALDPRHAPRRTAPGHVTATLLRGTSLAALYRARLFITAGFHLYTTGRLLIPHRGTRDGDSADDELAAAIAQALTSPPALGLLGRLTRGPVRYRLSFPGAGHRRAAVLRIAAAVSARRPELVNDPTATTWDVEVLPRELRLVPRRLEDPRFTYRRRDVPAASHPTVAAALAHVGGARPDDVVWDPFVGSGAELVERARLGPYRALHGGDLDAEALAAAAENLAAAGHPATLERRDARLGPPPGTTLVITNPPMGQRVLSRDRVAPLLLRLVDVVAAALPAGGRMVWLSPIPKDTADRAGRAGLTVRRRHPVDLGGIETELQLFEK